MLAQGDDEKPPDEFAFPLMFTWSLPPLPSPPDLLVLATELAGVGGTQLPLEVSAIDSFASVTDAPERSLTSSPASRSASTACTSARSSCATCSTAASR